MTLRPIPVENNGPHTKNKKQFNPGQQIKKRNGAHHLSLKTICLRLVAFINRGSRFTFQQIDEIIMTLHHAILSLQKRKQEMVKKKNSKS